MPSSESYEELNDSESVFSLIDYLTLSKPVEDATVENGQTNRKLSLLGAEQLSLPVLDDLAPSQLAEDAIAKNNGQNNIKLLLLGAEQLNLPVSGEKPKLSKRRSSSSVDNRRRREPHKSQSSSGSRRRVRRLGDSSRTAGEKRPKRRDEEKDKEMVMSWHRKTDNSKRKADFKPDTREKAPSTSTTRRRRSLTFSRPRRARSKSNSTRRRRSVNKTSTSTTVRTSDKAGKREKSKPSPLSATKEQQERSEIETRWQRNTPGGSKTQSDADQSPLPPPSNEAELKASNNGTTKAMTATRAKKPAHLRVYQSKNCKTEKPRNRAPRKKKVTEEGTFVWQREPIQRANTDAVGSQSERVDKLALGEVAKKLGQAKKLEVGKRAARSQLRGRRAPKPARTTRNHPKVDARGELNRGQLKSHSTLPEGDTQFTWRREPAQRRPQT